MVFKTLSALVVSTRPLDWSKPLANMILGYFAALIVLGSTASLDWQLFAISAIIVCPLLWGGLYVVNDWTDLKNDRAHFAKKERPIAAGKVKPSIALAFGVFLVFLAFGFGFFLNNPLLLVCMSLMLLNEWFYTMEPFYLKRRAVIDLVCGVMVNPILRFLAGWALVTQSLLQVPVSMLVFVVTIQLVFYILFRLNSREVEKLLGFKSSVVVFGEKNMRRFALLSFIIAIFSYVYACATVLSPKFLFPLFLSGLVLPVYFKALDDSTHIKFKRMKRMIYLHKLGFALLFAAMFFF